MKNTDLLTQDDLNALEVRLKTFLKEQFTHPVNTSKKPEYIRTREVKKLLKVSDNKLRHMREVGEIPFTFIGQTYYYPEDQILLILENNLIFKNKKS